MIKIYKIHSRRYIFWSVFYIKLFLKFKYVILINIIDNLRLGGKYG